MRDGMIVQAGKYNDLLNSGLDFKELVAAHETCMELVEMSTTIPSKSSPSPQISPQLSLNHREANGGNNSLDQPKSDNRTSKLIKEEEKETGKIGFWGYYLASSHELTRLDSITKAPVIHHFSESISGVTKIRRGPSQLCVGIIKTVMQVQVKPPLDLWQEVANLLQLPPTFLHSV
ncbi:hypothetical protein ACE6H2_028743 [Prunus campanulata]